MKTISLTFLLLMASAVVAPGDDTPATPAPKRTKIIVEYSFSPPQVERPSRGIEVPLLTHVGSKEWLLRAGQRDRDLLSPWESWRLNAWHTGCSFIEPSPSANGLTGAWR